MSVSVAAAAERKLAIFDENHVKLLFATPSQKLAYNRIVNAALIGLAFPL